MSLFLLNDEFIFVLKVFKESFLDSSNIFFVNQNIIPTLECHK